ncbi:transglutaminaseTgpA domain-containing protein [Nocardioides zeae]|uniref:TransglutaminaseTgpA domain-containing protein n=1 Tax=Nocardioides imazamoxiresistens TaxID=3231893 RepID=A0ABU3PZ12_9ACTN|nr:transglutaminaseTgpA domain-containing protein [Nocardioides zeae]MDT9594497.1 transglutaminaseTgpA domain-containing protein [Nocardioides zeae]
MSGGVVGRVLRPTATAALAMATAIVVLQSWDGFTTDRSQLVVPAVVGGAALVLSGALARLARLPAVVTALVQLAVAVLLGTAIVAGAWPGPGAFGEVVDRLADATDAARAYPPPVPSVDGGIGPLLVVATLALLWMCDTLAGTVRAAPVVGLPLLAAYSLPVTILQDDSVVVWGVVGAVGYLALLAAQEQVDTAAWGRPHRAGRSPARLPVAAPVVGAATVALAVLVPLLVPVLDLGILDRARTGQASGDAVVLDDPTANLQGNLQRGEDVPLVELRTRDPRTPAPSYLRVSVLAEFDEDLQQWVAGELDERPLGEGIVRPEGVSATDPQVSWELEATDAFRSTWLPVLDDLTAIRADEGWRYRPQAGDFPRSDTTVAGRSWSLEQRPRRLTTEQLVDTDAGVDVDGLYVADPEVDERVTALAEEVAGGADDAYDAALALQTYFRDPRQFSYDLDVSAEGDDALTEFLFDTRTGFCQHFASAMAVMAREIGIPSRVVVGFLQPQPNGAGTWEYSAHDLHAWPELYFPGAGWVRFEPTPAQRAARVPPYATGAPAEDPSAEPSTPTTAPPSTSTPPSATATPGSPDEADADEPGDDRSDRVAGVPRWIVVSLAVLAGAVLLLGLALLPAVARARRRRARRRQGAEGAWAELRDGWVDHRLDWPDDRSPAATARAVLDDWPDADAAPAGAVRTLETMVVAVERERYARGDAARTGAAAGADQVDGALAVLEARATTLPRSRRWIARLAPPSLLGRRRADEPDADE